MTWKQHPLSAAFPAMSDDEWDGLFEGIKANGLKDAVVMHEGMVLDGWHRVQCCQVSGTEIRTKDIPSDRDPVAYVISKNAHRRHLTASQKAIAIVRCSEWREAGSNQHSGGSVPGTDPPPSNKDMANQVGVSESTIEQAKTAEKAGLGDDVASGKKSAKKAASEARGSDKDKTKRPQRWKSCKRSWWTRNIKSHSLRNLSTTSPMKFVLQN